VTTRDLLAELAQRAVEIRFATTDGKDYCALFIDGARVGSWERVPK
jgi:hypothetical protein